MNDEPESIRLQDNPSIETQLALIVQALNRLTRSQVEDRGVLRELRDQVRTQNGNVTHIQDWQNIHNDHHGRDDMNIARRIAPVLGWRVFAGAVALGAGLASIIGLVIQLTLRLS